MAAASNVSVGAFQGPNLHARPKFADVMRRLAGFVHDFGAAVRASHEVEYLLDCSDVELERRGLRRSEIVPHVFGRHLGLA